MKVVIVLLTLLSAQCLHATIQRSDPCIIDKDTMYIDMYESWDILYGPFREVLSKNVNPRHLRSDCFRGYIGSWTLKDSLFYLEDIKTDVGSENLNKTFESISKRSFTQNGLLADWITGTIYVGIEMGVPWVHVYEMALHIKEGKLIGLEEFGSREPPIGISYAARNRFLYQGIDKNALNERTESDLFYVQIHVAREGVLDSISLIQFDSTSTLHKQLVENLKSLNYWGQCFYKGEAIAYERSMFTSTSKKSRRQRIRILR